MRRFRFGVLGPASDHRSWHALAHEVEDRGYDLLALTDHLDLSGAHVSRLAWLPALASAAAVTTRLRFTTMVANQDLRHPAVLAREVATLDILSEGRFELGIGAGWNPVEYRWAGIPLDSPGTRIERLGEVIDIMRGLLDDAPDAFTYEGTHFTITDMPRQPASVQQPLPIMVGGSGPRMLALGAEKADIVNINTLKDPRATDIVLGERLATIPAGGRDPELALSLVLVAVGDTPADAVRSALPSSPFAQHVAQQQSIDSIADAAHVLAGSHQAMTEELLRRREAWGVTTYVIPSSAMGAFQPVLEALHV